MATTVGTNSSVTGSNDVYDRTMETDWIATIALSIVLYCIVFWILISLITYGVKTRKWRQIQNYDSDNLNTGMIYTSVVVCAVLCLSYYTVSLVYINIGFVKNSHDTPNNVNDSLKIKKSDDLCDLVTDLLKSIYAFVLFSSYMFLWLRQRAFFNNKLLNAKFNRSVKVFSILSIFFIFFGGISALIFSIYPNNTACSKDGCVDKPSIEDNNLFWFVSCATAVLVFGKASLFYLLAYALLSSASISVSDLSKNSKNSRKKNDSVDQKKITVFSIRPSSKSLNISCIKQRSKARIQLIIKKTLVFAILSIIADILTIVIEYMMSKSGQNKRAAVLTGQVSSALTIIFLLLSFVSWKQMLLSPLKLTNISIYSDDINAANQYH